MNSQNQPLLSFKGVDILHVDFDIQRPLRKTNEVSVNCKPFGVLNTKRNDLFNIIMDVQVNVEEHFQLNLRAIGSFQLSEQTPEDLRKNFINSNAVAIMFPYVRSFVTTFTANVGGIPGGIVLPPRFFEGDLEIINAE